MATRNATVQLHAYEVTAERDQHRGCKLLLTLGYHLQTRASD